jgi:hypothetical protein
MTLLYVRLVQFKIKELEKVKDCLQSLIVYVKKDILIIKFLYVRNVFINVNPV